MGQRRPGAASCRTEERVDFDREVVLVGRANRLELWGREQWEAEMVQALDDDPDELACQLGQTDLQL